MHDTNLRKEFDTYYSSYDPLVTPLTERIKQIIADHPEDSSYMRKTRVIEMFCRETPVHLFANTPLFFEFSSGRGRCTWGGLYSQAATYLHNSTAEHWLTPYADALKDDRAEGFMHGGANPVGIDHFCAGYDNLLMMGLNGIIAQAEAKRNACVDERKRDFYTCVIRCNRALIELADRFSTEAARLAQDAPTEELKAHYNKIAEAAAHCPAKPPRNFYEALAFIVFYRECVGSVEGIGISTFGQLDRLLIPYYRADLEAGRVTPDEAKELICDLLSYTSIRFLSDTRFYETSTTIELGGCDREGNVVYNELTDLILQAVIDVRSISTKINCRISKAHPAEYLNKIAAVQLANLPCIMMHNDEVLIPARVNQGQEVADARLYLGCGCHEVVLANTEVCTRADTFISLPRILLETLKKGHDYPTFDAFYREFLGDAQFYYDKIVRLKNKGEKHWCEYAPMPLYSSSLTGTLDSGKDITEGGAKYNTTALSLLGAATVIDSLYSIKHLVFDEKKLTIARFVQILNENFENDQVLRHYIVNRIPKHGTNNPVLNEFSAQVLEDFSTMAGQINARGGKYLPAFYPHDLYRRLGLIIGATPDGRAANTPLSRGVSPSEFVETDSPLEIIHSLRHIDFTKFADSFITEITLPQLEDTPQNRQIIIAIIQAFLDAEGSSLQLNLLDHEMLVEAQNNPEKYKRLMVRVCGYSAVFVTLSKETQDEIIQRAIR